MEGLTEDKILAINISNTDHTPTTAFAYLQYCQHILIFTFCSCQSVQENKARAVRQFHFHGWPEVGIPTDGKGMINIIAAVQKQQQQSGNHPITVHCR